MCIRDRIRIVFVIRNQNRLHVEPSVAVRKCVTVALVRLPLPIGFQIALSLIHIYQRAESHEDIFCEGTPIYKLLSSGAERMYQRCV